MTSAMFMSLKITIEVNFSLNHSDDHNVNELTQVNQNYKIKNIKNESGYHLY